MIILTTMSRRARGTSTRTVKAVDTIREGLFSGTLNICCRREGEGRKEGREREILP